ncbi:MAG: fatty acid desaturase [Pseudobdellovibrio sp.]
MIPYFVLLHQIFAHVGLICLIIYFPAKYWLITLIVYFVLYCFGGTITYHRLLSHDSFKPAKWFYYLGSVLGVLSCSGSPIAWVATHKKHHRFTDQKNDPHSMRFMAWYKIQWLSMMIPVEPKYAAKLLRSKFQLFLHRNYFLIHSVYIFGLAFINYKMIIYLYLAPAALVWEAGSIINTICHKWGYVNYQLDDDSKNNRIVALLTFGEGLHNNHHARQANFNFKRKPGEIDLGGVFIKYLNQKV